MKVKMLLSLVLTLSFASLILSFFSFLCSYSALIEVKRILPYASLPLPYPSPSTAIYPTILTGKFVFVTSSLALGLSLLIVIILLIFVFKKKV